LCALDTHGWTKMSTVVCHIQQVYKWEDISTLIFKKIWDRFIPVD